MNELLKGEYINKLKLDLFLKEITISDKRDEGKNRHACESDRVV